MKDAELDAMVEAENARAWAELNREDSKARFAVRKCEKAIKAIAEAGRMLTQAAQAVEFTPEEYRLASLAMGLEEYECAINKQLERMK